MCSGLIAPMATEIFTFSDDDGYNERRGFIEDVLKLSNEYTKANGITDSASAKVAKVGVSVKLVTLTPYFSLRRSIR